MGLDADDVAALSRLIDVALALAPDAREAWLDALPERHRHLAPRLRKALEVQRRHAGMAGAEAAGPFMTLPRVADAAPSARAGEQVGPYRLLCELGHGGMGAVWLAERADGAFERQVALKLPRLKDDQALDALMARERSIAARLEHPNIARLYDAGVDPGGRPYIAMELVDGVPIDRHCNERRLPLHERIALFQQVLRAVGHAHGRLVVHRDLKPANVLVSADGQARLLDFGISQLLGAIETPGASPLLTPQYAAPEQITGGSAGVASDIYSLGVLLHELLTGVLPQPGQAPSALAADPQARRELAGELDAILAKAMAWEPAARYDTAQAFEHDLHRHLAGLPVAAMNGGRLYVARKFVARYRYMLGAAALGLVLLVTGVTSTLLQTQKAQDAAERTALVKAFMAELFRADLQARGDPAAPAPNLVERGAAVIGRHFAADSAAQGDLYGLLAGVCADMGAWRLAADYAERRAGLAGAENERDAARLQWAHALLEDGRAPLAEPLLQTLTGRTRANEPLGAQARVLLARALFANSRVDAARALVAALAEGRDPRGPGATRTLAWLAALRGEELMAEDRLDDALAQVRQAIELGERAEGADSLLAVEVRLTAARWLRSLGDGERAASFFVPAMAVLRRHGGAHAVRAAQETARHAWQLFSIGAAIRSQDAIETIDQARRTLASLGGMVPPSMREQVDFWLGEVKADSGDLVGASALMLPVADRVLAQALLLSERYAIVTALGYLARDLGRHTDADRWLRLRQQFRREMQRDHLPYAADDYMLIATNLSMAGRHDEAEKVIDAAPRFDAVRLAGWRPDKYNQLMQETRARILLDRGQADTALKVLPERAPDGHDDSAGVVSLRTLRGQAWCRSGRADEGLALLSEQIAIVGRDAHPHKPELAWLRALAAPCALAAGQPERARVLAQQAREALAAQPRLAPYYRAVAQ